MLPQATKNRFDGDLGKVSLSFDKESLTLSRYFKEQKASTTKWGVSPSKGVPSSPLAASYKPKRGKPVVAKPDRFEGQLSSRQSSLASSTSPPISIIKAREGVKLQFNATPRAHEAPSSHPIGTSQTVKAGTKLSDLTRTRQQADKSWNKQTEALDPKELQDMMKFVEEVDLLG